MNDKQTALLQNAIALATMMDYDSMLQMLTKIMEIERGKSTTEDPQEIYNLNVSGKD